MISLISPRQSGTSYNDGLEVSGSGGTVIGSQDVVDLAGGDNLHIGGDGKDGVYVVIDAGDGLVSPANNNSYLGHHANRFRYAGGERQLAAWQYRRKPSAHLY